MLQKKSAATFVLFILWQNWCSNYSSAKGNTSNYCFHLYCKGKHI